MIARPCRIPINLSTAFTLKDYKYDMVYQKPIEKESMLMSKMKVLIVDDSAYSRQAIKKMLETDSHIEVSGIASDG